MKKRIVSLVLLLLSLVLVGCVNKKDPVEPSAKPSFPTVAATLEDNESDETIFVKLNKKGEVETLKGVVHLADVEEETYVTYKGKYLSGGHSNLSNILDLDVNAETGLAKIPVLKDDSDYFFEVALDKEEYELPFKFSFKYKLEGVETTYENLVGKSGNITITLEVTPNYESGYLAQIQLPIDIVRNKITSSEGASASVLVGRLNTLAYMVMPNASQTFTIELKSSSFSLGLVQIALQEFDMLSAIPFDMSMFGNVSLLPTAATLVKDQIGVLKYGIQSSIGGLDSLITMLHPGLISAFESLENTEMPEIFTEQVVGNILAPAALIQEGETVPEKLAILGHVLEIQNQLEVIEEVYARIAAYIETHQPNVESYIETISGYDTSYEKLDKMLTTVTEIEQILRGIVVQLGDINNLIEEKDAFKQTLTLLSSKLESMKIDNLGLIREFRLYEKEMTELVNYVIELLDINISLATELTDLNGKLAAYSEALKQALPHFTVQEEIIVMQTAIVTLDGIENDPENIGVINALNYMLSNFDLEELATRKVGLEAILELTGGELQLAQPLRAFILLNEGLTIKQEHQQYSFYQGLEMLTNVKDYLDLLPNKYEIESFIHPDNPKPKSVQFVIVY